MIGRLEEVSWINFFLMTIITLITLRVYPIHWKLRTTHERNRLLDKIVDEIKRKN